MYLGIGVRTALAAGYNRFNPKTSSPAPESDAIARTWWGLYSLEVELSFSLGRPDSLGVDAFHNQRLPYSSLASEPESELSIITHALPLAQITRRVSVEIYHSSSSISRKLSLAGNIHAALTRWSANLPLTIRPHNTLPQLREPKWARRQRLILGIRYRNVQMAMYRPFLAYYTRTNAQSSALRDAVNQCLAAAMETIAMMHQIFLQHTFFRTWWWNVTYISFPASVLLTYIARHPQREDEERRRLILDSVAKAIEVLEAMDECDVAKRAAQLIGTSLKEVSGAQDVVGAASAATPRRETTTNPQRNVAAERIPLVIEQDHSNTDTNTNTNTHATKGIAMTEQMHNGDDNGDGTANTEHGTQTPSSSGGGAPTPQTLTLDDFNYADLLLEEGWSTLFDDFDTNAAAAAAAAAPAVRAVF